MKKILVIDESELIRNFLREKLSKFGFETEIAVNGLEGSMKMRSFTPDLVIMDYYLSRLSAVELLVKKRSDPNLRDIPVLFASTKISREVIIELSKYGIRKFITKPIRIDALAKAISELLDVRIELDSTPCIIDANFNEEILFIEVARGLNSEKIELLRYRLKELIRHYRIEMPRVLLMLTGLEISADDSIKLRTLLDTVLSSTAVKTKNFKVLTTSAYVREFIGKRGDLKSITVHDSLPSAMDELLGDRAGGYKSKDGMIHEDFLRAGSGAMESGEAINLHFQSEQGSDSFNFSALAPGLKLAVVDDDFVILELIKTAFEGTGLQIQGFSNGRDFVQDKGVGEFDLVFLDLLMPEMDGFQVLTQLGNRSIRIPVVVLSAVNKRETVVQALQMGVKSYLVKPIQPQMVYKKAMEIFRLNF